MTGIYMFLMLSLCESVLILHDWYLYVPDVVTMYESMLILHDWYLYVPDVVTM